MELARLPDAMGHRTAILPVLLVLAVPAASACRNAGTEGPGEPGRPDTGGPAVVDTAGPAGAVSYGELRAEVCDTLRNTFRCARAIEARRLTEGGRARRSGDTLRLPMDGGEPVVLVDVTGDPSSVVHYSYQDHWPDSGLFLVQMQFYEGSRYLLIDDRTGERTRIPDWPLRSPDGRRFAVLSLDLEAGYGPNTLQVWRLEDGTPALEWDTTPTDWGPADGAWVDTETLRFTQRGDCGALGGAGRGPCDRPALVRLVGADWRIEPMGEARARD